MSSAEQKDMTRSQSHPYFRKEAKNYRERDRKQCQRQRPSLIQDSVNTVQILFSKMNLSLLDSLAPSWLSDFLAALQISSPLEEEKRTQIHQNDVQTCYSDQKSIDNTVPVRSVLEAHACKPALNCEESRPPELDPIGQNDLCQNDLQGQGQMRSLLDQEEKLLASGSLYSSAEIPNTFMMRDHQLNRGSLVSAGNRSFVQRPWSLSGNRSRKNKRKVFNYKEKCLHWKRRKIDKQKNKSINMRDAMTGDMNKARFRDGFGYNQTTQFGINDTNFINNRQLLSDEVCVMDVKLRVKKRPSRLIEPRCLTDSTSRRILNVIDRKPKPLHMIIPDLQIDPAVPKLKYFIPALAHKRKSVTSVSMSTVNTGISCSKSTMSKGTTFMKSATGPQTQPTQIDLNPQSVIPTEISNKTPESKTEEMAASSTSSVSAVTLPSKISEPVSSAFSVTGPKSALDKLPSVPKCLEDNKSVFSHETISVSSMSTSISTTVSSKQSDLIITSRPCLQASKFSSSVRGVESSLVDSEPAVELSTNNSNTTDGECNSVTTSPPFMMDQKSDRMPFSSEGSNTQTLTSVDEPFTAISSAISTCSFSTASLTRSRSPSLNSGHETTAFDSSTTIPVSFLVSESSSVNLSPDQKDVLEVSSDFDANSSTTRGLVTNTSSVIDMKSKESWQAAGICQQYNPYVGGLESKAFEECRSNVPTINLLVGDVPPMDTGFARTCTQDVAALKDMKYRPSDQTSQETTNHVELIVTTEPEKLPEDFGAFHKKHGNKFINHASYQVSKVSPVKPVSLRREKPKPDVQPVKEEAKPDVYTVIGAAKPDADVQTVKGEAKIDVQAVKGEMKNDDSSRKNKIKRLPDITREQSSISSVTIETLDISDVTAIPDPISPPKPDLISENVKFSKVFCDIETSSLAMTAEIVQIAAVCEDETFDQYILPLRQIEQEASKVTGLTCDGGVLYHRGNAVRTLDLKSALERFLGWLVDRKPCVLVGHNFKNFDYPRIYRAFRKYNLLNAFHQIIIGFVDSFPLFKTIYPDEKNYKQETLVAKYVKETYDAHNALGDVKSLQTLFSVSENITHQVFCLNSYSAKWYVEYHKYKTKCNENADTFKHLVDCKLLSKSTVDKIAGSGFQMKHLKLIHNQTGEETLTEILVDRASVSKATVKKLLPVLVSDTVE